MPIIEINNLSKRFMVDINPLTLFNLCKRITKPQNYYREFWALKDIEFMVEKGDRVAIIGNNGSGKTTLLRIIAGLYQETQGSISVNGSIAAFLHMGIGMERNLTAIENIYLFGAIMGLTRSDIHSKIDDIIHFAELADFVHCPLRDFSSGMIQRLVFAIAREVDSEILLLDEMLATGDIGFRQKCYQVMETYTKTSKTIIMTSHEMELIKNFCNKCIWLEKGRQMAFGQTAPILADYIAYNQKPK